MKYFLANHKMNFTYKDMNSYWKTFNEIYVKNKENPKLKMENKKVGFFVPFTNLKETKKLIKNSGVMLGAQNVHFADNGSYTGEISADMLKECQTDIVLIGHSERRKFAGETDEDINKKIKQMMKYNIKSLLCIGETKEERKKLLTKKVIASQLKKALADLYENEFNNIIIAYEPVWAIGTGEVATNKMIEEAILLIREVLKDLFNEKIASQTPIIYGGSVTAENCKQLNKIKNLNGFLIGASSLNPTTFNNIIANC